MTTEIIASFKNEEDQVISYVTIGKNGFHVSMKDIDSGEYLPYVSIIPNKDQAIEKAKKIVNFK